VPSPRTTEVSRPGLRAADLLLAHGTLRPCALEERVAAAAEAGFRGIGLAGRAWAALRAQGWTGSRLRALLEAHDVRLVETEGLFGFSTTGEVRSGVLAGRRYQDREAEAAVFDLASQAGVRHVNVNGAFEPGPLEPTAGADLAALCDRAAEHGLLVALEPVPCTNVPDLRTAMEVVRAADRPNAGLCVDSWHFFRGAADEQQLRDLPADRVFVVQIDDGPHSPVDADYLVDTIHHRRLPGDGDFPLDRFLTTLDDIGVRAPLSVEVLSDDLDRLEPRAAAGRVGAAVRRLLGPVPATWSSSGDHGQST
jgi:sugar phosphate isomerase/epimerase